MSGTSGNITTWNKRPRKQQIWPCQSQPGVLHVCEKFDSPEVFVQLYHNCTGNFWDIYLLYGPKSIKMKDNIDIAVSGHYLPDLKSKVKLIHGHNTGIRVPKMSSSCLLLNGSNLFF